MAVKILSRAGVSLADTYDVRGSRAHVQLLEPREVTLVHEMGGTINSERIGSFIRRGTTTALLQSATFDILLQNLPDGIWRILGVQIFANVIARVATAAVLLRDPTSEREIPLLAFDAANDTETAIRMEDDGLGIATHFLLNTSSPFLSPGLGVGTGQRQQVNELVLRGVTAAFGAGTVNIRMIIQIAFTHVGGGLSSIGLPLASW